MVASIYSLLKHYISHTVYDEGDIWESFRSILLVWRGCLRQCQQEDLPFFTLQYLGAVILSELYMSGYTKTIEHVKFVKVLLAPV